MKNGQRTARTPKELVNELHGLIAEAETMIAGPAAERLDGAFDSLRSRFAEAQGHLGDAYDGARKRVIGGAKSADAAIRANPYKSLAIAAGAGLLVGLLLMGRRDK
jgi:ElaB/YqjD/DUF883 family membrane-anchored ribosome-binding protein